MKKIFISTVIFVLLLAVSVFALTRTSVTNENSCPLKHTAQISETNYDYSNVVVAGSDENCCQKGADCCKGGGACCKRKRK